jgi:hypothetical protein
MPVDPTEPRFGMAARRAILVDQLAHCDSQWHEAASEERGPLDGPRASHIDTPGKPTGGVKATLK